jgi:uncharacterized protein YegP (UPF0339 family)
MGERPLFEIGPYVGWPSADGRFFYEEIAGNGEIENTSQMYETAEHAEEGAQAALDRARES